MTVRSLVVKAVPIAALAAALAGAPPALAIPPLQDLGVPAGPLTSVAAGNELSCQVQHTGDTSFEFFPSSASPGDCGTLLLAGGALYAPDFANHGSTATSGIGAYTPYSPVSQTGVTGSGGAGDPRKVVTVVTAGATGIQLTQTDSYVVGEESYRTDIAVRNTGGSAQSVILYRAGDCFLQNTDAGFGFADAASKSVGCSAAANNTPPNRIEEWVPITGGNNFTQDSFSSVWSQIGTHTPFNDACTRCAEMVDNGAGISWSVDVPPGATVTRSHYTTFSPTGVAGPPPSAPAPTPPVVGPQGNPLGLPTRHGCVDRRKFSFKLHHARAHPVVEVDVFINNKFTRAVTGPNISKLTLTRLPIGKFKVRLVATQDSGAQLISQRTYKGCRKSKPRTRRGHR
jgi:hypothetical protein